MAAIEKPANDAIIRPSREDAEGAVRTLLAWAGDDQAGWAAEATTAALDLRAVLRHKTSMPNSGAATVRPAPLPWSKTQASTGTVRTSTSTASAPLRRSFAC